MMSMLRNGAGMAVLSVELSVKGVETSWLESSTAPLVVQSLRGSSWLRSATLTELFRLT